MAWHNGEEAQFDQSFSSSFSEEEEIIVLDGGDSGVKENES